MYMTVLITVELIKFCLLFDMVELVTQISQTIALFRHCCVILDEALSITLMPS